MNKPEPIDLYIEEVASKGERWFTDTQNGFDGRNRGHGWWTKEALYRSYYHWWYRVKTINDKELNFDTPE